MRDGRDALAAFAAACSDRTDAYFRARLAEIATDFPDQAKDPFALVAVGGYGRGELCPGSDIDVLLVFARRIPKYAEPFSQALFFPLWDLGLDLGHGVRTVRDCLTLAKDDFQVLASLVDARLLAGDTALFRDFLAQVEKKALRRKAGRFAEWISSRNAERERTFGDASGLLEPELKNGLGGLRDAHQIRWLARVLPSRPGEPPLFDANETDELARSEAFVLAARTALHLAAGRKNDKLFFELAPRVAELLSYAAETPGLAVERFLSDLHQAMGRIKAMREALFATRAPDKHPPRAIGLPRGMARQPDGLAFAPDADPGREPLLALEIFRAAAAAGLPLAWTARRLVRSRLAEIAALRENPQTLAALLDVLAAQRGEEACLALLDTGLLACLIPEFGAVEHLVQFDGFHVHPVGRHTLRTVRILAGFLHDQGGRPALVARALAHPERLLLAGLFHDLGKGRGEHEKVGAAIAGTALSRLGLDPAAVDDVRFLVEQHLLLPRTATRRDLCDEGVAAGVAAEIKSPERLDMLYLLSLADSEATGPLAFNPRTAALLSELFSKVRRLLTEGPLAEPFAPARMLSTRDRVRAKAAALLDPEFVERALAALPPRATLVLEPETLVRHLQLSRRLNEAVAEDRTRKPSGKGGVGVVLLEACRIEHQCCFELTLAALDRPGLFATLAGAISLHGLDIHSAEVFTWTDGTAMDVFQVSEPQDALFPDEAFARIGRSASYALQGKLDLEFRLAERRNSPLVRQRKTPPFTASVTVDNRASDFHTLVEVKATDRLGLLYDIASAISRQGADIQLARIGTAQGRVADIFYVREPDGRKIEEPDRIAAIEAALLAAAQGDRA
jgi:[protein-PII] uridylyltransferase